VPVLAMTKLRNRLQAAQPDLRIELKNVRVNRQLYGCTGFVTDPATKKVVYVSTDTNGLDSRQALLRTAEHTRDFTGGNNNYAPTDEQHLAVIRLLKKSR